jgi:hypothetical protein
MEWRHPTCLPHWLWKGAATSSCCTRRSALRATFPRERQLSPCLCVLAEAAHIFVSAQHPVLCAEAASEIGINATRWHRLFAAGHGWRNGVAFYYYTHEEALYGTDYRVSLSPPISPRLCRVLSGSLLTCRSTLSSPIHPECAVSGASWPYPATSPAATRCGRQPRPPPTAPSSFAHFKSSPSRARSACRSSRPLTLVRPSVRVDAPPSRRLEKKISASLLGNSVFELLSCRQGSWSSGWTGRRPRTPSGRICFTGLEPRSRRWRPTRRRTSSW